MSRLTLPAAWNGFNGAATPVSFSTRPWRALLWLWDRFSEVFGSRLNSTQPAKEPYLSTRKATAFFTRKTSIGPTWPGRGQARFHSLYFYARPHICGRADGLATGSAKPLASARSCCWYARRRFWGTQDWRPTIWRARPAPRSRCTNFYAGWNSRGWRGRFGGAPRRPSPSYASFPTFRSCWRATRRGWPSGPEERSAAG